MCRWTLNLLSHLQFFLTSRWGLCIILISLLRWGGLLSHEMYCSHLVTLMCCLISLRRIYVFFPRFTCVDLLCLVHGSWCPSSPDGCVSGDLHSAHRIIWHCVVSPCQWNVSESQIIFYVRPVNYKVPHMCTILWQYIYEYIDSLNQTHYH